MVNIVYNNTISISSFFFSILLAGSSALYYWYYSFQYPRAGSGQSDTEIQPKLVHESVFNVIEIPGKGKGAIAARNIKVSTGCSGAAFEI